MANEKLERFESINASIKKVIKDEANDKALELVVSNSLANEVKVRSDLILSGSKMYADTVKAINKCKPDDVKYRVPTDKDGKSTDDQPQADVSYTAEKWKELNALKKKMGEMDAALLLALGENQDYSKLQNLVSKK